MMALSHIPHRLYQATPWYIFSIILFLAALSVWFGFRSLRCRPQPTPAIVRTDHDAPIYRLPPELIQHIAAFLQPSSASIFVLSNKHFLAILGTQFLKVKKPYKLQYLKAIQEQVPNHLICHACVSFHPRRAHRSGRGWFAEPKCFHEAGKFNYGLRGRFSLLFPDIQQIMNRRRFGENYGFSTKEISYKRAGKMETTHSWSGETSCSLSIEKTAEAKFSGNNLLLRTESRCKFPWFNAQAKMIAIYAPINFCPHISDKELNFSSFSRRKKTYAKCSVCDSEFRIKINHVDSFLKEVCTTSWYTLGSWRDPFDSDNLQWLALTTGRCYTRRAIFIWEREATCRKAFENAESDS